jgi:hypothetical protein
MKKLHIILLLTTLILCLSCDDTEKACNPPLGTISATVVEASDLPANTIALQGSVHTGFEGVWKILEGNGGSFANANMPQTTFTGLTGEMYILRWELKGCDIFNKDVSVTIGCETLQANAGVDQQTTNTTITLNGNLPTGTTGLWTIVNGNNGGLNNATESNATFTGIAGNTYTLRWTLTNACGQTSFDEVSIQINTSVNESNRYVQTLVDEQPHGSYQYNNAGQMTLANYTINGNTFTSVYNYVNEKLSNDGITNYFYNNEGIFERAERIDGTNKRLYFFENGRLIKIEYRNDANITIDKDEYEYTADGYVLRHFEQQNFTTPTFIRTVTFFTEYTDKVSPPMDHLISSPNYYLPWKFIKTSVSTGSFESNNSYTYTFDALGRMQTGTSTNNLTNTSSVTTYVY